MNRKTSRRDFLKGKAAVRAVAELAQGAVPGEGPDPWTREAADQSYLIRVSRPAMATQFEVVLNAGQHEGGTEASLEALDLVEALEEQLSVFRATSEISRLNRTGADGPVKVEPQLFGLLKLAQELHAETGGALDITASPLSKVWGFQRGAGTVPNEDALALAMKNVGGHLVEIDAARQTVRFRQPGVELNLGSIGKGFALDRLAEVLKRAGVHDFLIHGGQSSILARGSRGSGVGAHGSGFRVQGSGSARKDLPQGPEPRTQSPEPSSPSPSDRDPRGWVVGIPHPTRKETRLAELRLRDRALGTSGSARQHFRHQGRRYGHILDARTGRPAEGVFSATAIAPTAAEADALSTAFYVMGADAALEFCRRRPEIAAVMVCPTHRDQGLEIRTAGLENHEFRILNG